MKGLTFVFAAFPLSLERIAPSVLESPQAANVAVQVKADVPSCFHNPHPKAGGVDSLRRLATLLFRVPSESLQYITLL